MKYFALGRSGEFYILIDNKKYPTYSKGFPLCVGHNEVEAATKTLLT